MNLGGRRSFKISGVGLTVSFLADLQNVSRAVRYKSSRSSPVQSIITCPVTPVISASPQALTKPKTVETQTQYVLYC